MNNNKAKIGAVNNAITEKTNNTYTNKSQTLLKYIVKQAGFGGLSQIASDTAGTVVNTVFDILTSIIP